MVINIISQIFSTILNKIITLIPFARFIQSIATVRKFLSVKLQQSSIILSDKNTIVEDFVEEVAKVEDHKTLTQQYYESRAKQKQKIRECLSEAKQVTEQLRKNLEQRISATQALIRQTDLRTEHMHEIIRRQLSSRFTINEDKIYERKPSNSIRNIALTAVGGETPSTATAQMVDQISLKLRNVISTTFPQKSKDLDIIVKQIDERNNQEEVEEVELNSQM